MKSDVAVNTPETFERKRAVKEPRPLTICYFGAYDPEYSRNKVLMAGLRMNGIAVRECHDASRFKPLRFVRLARKYHRMAADIDVIVVGACGHVYMPLAKLLALAGRKRIVFDAFVSQYDTVITDRQVARPGSLRAWWYRRLDCIGASLADITLLDTKEHVEFYAAEYRLDVKRFEAIPISADTDVFRLRTAGRRHEFTVTFVGTFIPLQGVPFILRAAGLLKHVPSIRMLMIGSGETYRAAVDLAKSLGLENISFAGPLPASNVADTLAESDVCLGIFGTTPKTQRVIPNKVYEAMAMGKPLITADTPAARGLLRHKVNALLVPVGDPQAIADAILDLMRDPALCSRLGSEAWETFRRTASPEIVGGQLADICRQLCERALAAR